jgi:hypothetical protein
MVVGDSSSFKHSFTELTIDLLLTTEGLMDSVAIFREVLKTVRTLRWDFQAAIFEVLIHSLTLDRRSAVNASQLDKAAKVIVYFHLTSQTFHGAVGLGRTSNPAKVTLLNVFLHRFI